MDEVSLEEFLLKYDFRITNDKVLKQNISNFYYDEDRRIFSIYLEDRS